MSADTFDVAVVGAGPVGLAGALALSRENLSVVLVGPDGSRSDGRTAALLEGSVDLLRRLDLWAPIEAQAGALRTLRIVDDTDSLFRPPPLAFEAAEIGLDAFGWNVENARLVTILSEAADRTPGLERRRVAALGCKASETARLELEDGSSVSARLVVAADGRRSRLRDEAGITTRETTYRQTAFTTVLEHERPHGDVSTEFHTRSGPFTLVPLPGQRSSLVWVSTPRHAARLAAASSADLARSVEIASHGLLGACAIDGPRGTTPLGMLTVDRWIAPRLALVGEAAHVLPPIGAQGLNLGFSDVAALVRLVTTARCDDADIGGDRMLAQYERERRADLRFRALAVDGLNRSLLTSALPVDAARGIGLGMLARIGPLRRALMRAGLQRRQVAGAA